MAIRLIDRYPNRANPANDDYPHGSGRNKSSPTAIDGTPFDENRFNDQEGFFQSLLEAAEVTPNNTPDTVPESQYADALSIVANGLVQIDVGGSTDAVLDYNQARVHGFRLTGALAGDIDVVVPDTERMYTVVNDTTGDFTVTVKTALGAGVVVPQGQTFVVRCDGADVVRGLDSQRTMYVGSVADLTAISSPIAGDHYSVTGYHPSSDIGGGLFYWDADKPKSEHDAATVIDPTKIFPSDWTVRANILDWYSPNNTGAGCFVKIHNGVLSPEEFGAFGTGMVDDTEQTQAAFDSPYTIEIRKNNRIERATDPVGGAANYCVSLTRPKLIRGAGGKITGNKAGLGFSKGDYAILVIDLYGNLSNKDTETVFDGIVFDGEDWSTDKGIGTGIAVSGEQADYANIINRVIVRNCHFYDLNQSAARTSGNVSESINSDRLIETFIFENNTVERTKGHATAFRFCGDAVVRGNHFIDYGLADASQTDWGDLATDITTGTFNGLVSNNVMRNGSSGFKFQDGVPSRAGGRFVATGNIIESDNKSRGFYGMRGSHPNTVFIGNSVKGFETGVDIFGGGTIVSNNVFETILSNLDSPSVGGGEAVSLVSNTAPDVPILIDGNTIKNCDVVSYVVHGNVVFRDNTFIDASLLILGQDLTNHSDLAGPITVEGNFFKNVDKTSAEGLIFDYRRRSPLTTDGNPIRDLVVKNNNFDVFTTVRYELGYAGEFGGVVNVSLIENSGVFSFVLLETGTFERLKISGNKSKSASTMIGVGSPSATVENLIITENSAKVLSGTSANRVVISVAFAALSGALILGNVVDGRSGDTAIRFAYTGGSKVVIKNNLALGGAAYDIDAGYTNVENY